MKIKINKIFQPFTPLSFRTGVEVLKMLLVFATIVSITSCKKSTLPNSNTTDNLFTENINGIKLQEPVLLSFSNNNSSIIDWQITPNANFEINKAGNYATLKFATTGVYTAIAKVGSKHATYIISVNNNLYNNVGKEFSLTAAKIDGISLNEEVLFTVNNAGSTPLVWKVSSNVDVIDVVADNKKAIVSFKSGNSGTVTVTQNGESVSRTIFLNDVANNNAIDTVPFIFGDKLNITPTLSNDKKTLYLTANTTYNYQCNTDKILSVSDNANNSFSVSYGGVVMSSTLCSTIVPANCINSFNNITNGLYPFIINYENKTFIGTLTVNNNKYDIGFVNNSLINFTKLHIE